MQILKCVLFTVLSALLYTSSANSYEQTEIESWIEYCPSKRLCFEHPASLKPASVQAIDSLAGQLENNKTVLHYDLGLYASTFRELTSANSAPIMVDGYKGKVLTFKNTIALTIEKIAGNDRFSMLLEYKDTLKAEEAERIFKSVKFNF
ncbi:MAG: hypothetical protein V7736_11080 [Colwellia polaris]|tara:strand:+ start:3151 stop:3597 length:447 start_codon:yes stop_codon:yes gene_type:complete